MQSRGLGAQPASGGNVKFKTGEPKKKKYANRKKWRYLETSEAWQDSTRLDSTIRAAHNARTAMSTTPTSFDAPLLGEASPSQGNYIQPTLGHGLRIWWAYYWPVSLISFFLIVGVSLLLRKAWESDVLSTDVVRWANRILPYAVVFAVSMIGIRRILGKQFRAFSIALLPPGAVVVGQPLPLSYERTLRVWWEFIWRTVVYSVVFRIAGSIALSLTMGIFASMGGLMGAAAPLVMQVLIDGAVGLFVIYSGILDEEFGDFRVSLVPRTGPVPVAQS